MDKTKSRPTHIYHNREKSQFRFHVDFNDNRIEQKFVQNLMIHDTGNIYTVPTANVTNLLFN